MMADERCNRESAGFSLIEMLVVLVIVSFVAGTAAFSLHRAVAGNTPARYAGQLSEQLTGLRYRAMNTGRVQSVEINMERKAVVSSALDDTILIPGNWGLTVKIGRETADVNSAPKVLFLPDGSSSGAEITISEPGGQTAYIRVNWLTGITEFSAHAF